MIIALNASTRLIELVQQLPLGPSKLLVKAWGLNFLFLRLQYYGT